MNLICLNHTLNKELISPNTNINLTFLEHNWVSEAELHSTNSSTVKCSDIYYTVV